MYSPNYQHYLDKTFDLARSILIKNEAAAAQINQLVEDLGQVVPADRYQWRYYMHLAGEYHSLDTPMEIRSLDTLKIISLDKTTLDTHPVTRDYYRLGGVYYRRLVERYPEQEQLVRGILHPISKDRAIDAPDYTILDYNKELVERNETNLIPLLQERINHYYDRWNVPGYHEIDELFTTSHFGILCYQLPLMIANIRLENCHTPYVHGFHIKEFLKSHGRLDRFYDFLTRGQQLFLYRNIRYIKTHIGKQDTLEWVIEKILTERGIGIADYIFRHDTSPLDDGEFHPKLEFYRRALNPFHRSVRTEEHTMEDILFKEREAAPSNYIFQYETLVDDGKKLKAAPRNLYPTKALESSIVDYSTGGYVTMAELLLNHWIHWALSDQYQGIIRIPHPKTGSLMELTPKDTVWLYFYCFNRAFGHTIDTPLILRPRMVRKDQREPFEEYASQVNRELVPDTLIQWFHRQPLYNGIKFSPRVVHGHVVSLLRDVNRQREAFSLQEDHRVRGHAEGLFWGLYETREYTIFNEHASLDQWMFEKGFDVGDLTRVEYEEFTELLFNTSTGLAELDNYTAAEIQKALVDLVSELSSYATQFIREVNRGPIRYLDRLAIRTGAIDGEGFIYDRAAIRSPRVLDLTTQGAFDIKWYPENELELTTHMHLEHQINMDCSTQFTVDVGTLYKTKVKLNPMKIKVTEV